MLSMVDFVTPGSMRLKVDEVSIPSPIISAKRKTITAKRIQLSSKELLRSNSRRLTRIKGSLVVLVNTYSFRIVLLPEVKWQSSNLLLRLTQRRNHLNFYFFKRGLSPRYMGGSFFVPLDAIPRIGLPIYNIYDASGNDRSPISNSLQHSIYLCLHSGLFGIGDRSFPQVSIDAT